jgi:hypothetical protein
MVYGSEAGVANPDEFAIFGFHSRLESHWKKYIDVAVVRGGITLEDFQEKKEIASEYYSMINNGIEPIEENSVSVENDIYTGIQSDHSTDPEENAEVTWKLRGEFQDNRTDPETGKDIPYTNPGFAATRIRINEEFWFATGNKNDSQFNREAMKIKVKNKYDDKDSLKELCFIGDEYVATPKFLRRDYTQLASALVGSSKLEHPEKDGKKAGNAGGHLVAEIYYSKPTNFTYEDDVNATAVHDRLVTHRFKVTDQNELRISNKVLWKFKRYWGPLLEQTDEKWKEENLKAVDKNGNQHAITDKNNQLWAQIRDVRWSLGAPPGTGTPLNNKLNLAEKANFYGPDVTSVTDADNVELRGKRPFRVTAEFCKVEASYNDADFTVRKGEISTRKALWEGERTTAPLEPTIVPGAIQQRQLETDDQGRRRAPGLEDVAVDGIPWVLVATRIILQSASGFSEKTAGSRLWKSPVYKWAYEVGTNLSFSALERA